MSLAGDNGLVDLLFLLDKGMLDSARIDPAPRNIRRARQFSSGDRFTQDLYMKSLVEAVAIILLFFLTPMIAVWVLISLARLIENIGDLPIDEKEALAVRHWAEGVLQAESSRAKRTTNFAYLQGRT
jgi:hypothetical protein